MSNGFVGLWPKEFERDRAIAGKERPTNQVHFSDWWRGVILGQRIGCTVARLLTRRARLQGNDAEVRSLRQC